MDKKIEREPRDPGERNENTQSWWHLKLAYDGQCGDTGGEEQGGPV
jgi:hypothetical protein